MKLPRETSQKLGSILNQARVARGLSFRNLKDLSGVDGGQASKICGGQFATLNPSVLKICNALDVVPSGDDAAPDQGVEALDSMRHRLEAEVLAVWDRTPEGGEKLVQLLRQLKAFRFGANGEEAL